MNNVATLNLTELAWSGNGAAPILGNAYGPFVNQTFNLDQPINGLWQSTNLVEPGVDFPVGNNNFLYFRVELTNLLEASANAGGTSEISKISEEVKLTVKIIPEPSTIALISLGFLAAIRRR